MLEKTGRLLISFAYTIQIEFSRVEWNRLQVINMLKKHNHFCAWFLRVSVTLHHSSLMSLRLCPCMSDCTTLDSTRLRWPQRWCFKRCSRHLTHWPLHHVTTPTFQNLKRPYVYSTDLCIHPGQSVVFTSRFLFAWVLMFFALCYTNLCIYHPTSTYKNILSNLFFFWFCFSCLADCLGHECKH
jgi:hypothetical protein